MLDKKQLAQIEHLIKKVGNFQIQNQSKVTSSDIEEKSLNQLVSYVDIESEKMLVTGLKSITPKAGFLTEEKTSNYQNDHLYWIIDPLDGTTNFLHGIPHWAISIALEHKQEIVAGIIYDPIKDELFSAQKGGGSWLNEQRLRVSNRTIFQEMLFATGIPFGESAYLENSLASIGNLIPGCAGIRRNGAASLDLAYVAAGRFDGFWEQNLASWDVASGILIVKEAGGILESIEENLNPIETGNIICSNNQEEVFKKFSEIIRLSVQ